MSKKSSKRAMYIVDLQGKFFIKPNWDVLGEVYVFMRDFFFFLLSFLWTGVKA